MSVTTDRKSIPKTCSLKQFVRFVPVTVKMHFLLISQAHLEIHAELKLLYPENRLKFFVTAWYYRKGAILIATRKEWQLVRGISRQRIL